MALCPLEELKSLVLDGAWTYASDHCKFKVREYDLEDEDVIRIVLALNPTPRTQGGHFRKEFGPARTDFGILQADDYLIQYDPNAHCICSPSQGLLFYVKLALFADEQGSQCVVVRLHPSS